jgi:hypothetical protein
MGRAAPRPQCCVPARVRNCHHDCGGSTSPARVPAPLRTVLLLWLSWLYLGLILISPKKVPVVFLRRFGLTSSNDITRKAFSRHLRGGFRLLTLDDRKFAAAPFRLRDAGATLSVAVLIGISFVTASQASCQRGIEYEERNQVWVTG